MEVQTYDISSLPICSVIQAIEGIAFERNLDMGCIRISATLKLCQAFIANAPNCTVEHSSEGNVIFVRRPGGDFQIVLWREKYSSVSIEGTETLRLNEVYLF